ncbi:hypothetical protein GZL_09157 [Streptomyces sp. 769]|nr:hypothetical protein GZL_09157 [Streptomyces sp. 769]
MRLHQACPRHHHKHQLSLVDLGLRGFWPGGTPLAELR